MAAAASAVVAEAASAAAPSNPSNGHPAPHEGLAGLIFCPVSPVGGAFVGGAFVGGAGLGAQGARGGVEKQAGVAQEDGVELR